MNCVDGKALVNFTPIGWFFKIRFIQAAGPGFKETAITGGPVMRNKNHNKKEGNILTKGAPPVVASDSKESRQERNQL